MQSVHARQRLGAPCALCNGRLFSARIPFLRSNPPRLSARRTRSSGGTAQSVLQLSSVLHARPPAACCCAGLTCGRSLLHRVAARERE